MARTSTKNQKIDPVAVIAIALLRVKTLADYHQIESANTPTDFEAAWQTLPDDEQSRINQIRNASPQLDLNALASLLTASDNVIQLQAIKAEHGEEATRKAWKLLPPQERFRLKTLCDNGQQPAEATAEQAESMTEATAPYQVEPTQPKTRSLFTISDDLEKLNELLDECSDDAQQQELIGSWFEQLGEERDKKLDGYAALITEMQARSEVRKAEAKRMMELATANENRAKLLKQRLQWFFETHNLKTVETARYKLSLAKNGGKQPLILNVGLSPTEMPERFQKVSIDLDTTAIREALSRGEVLEWAVLGDRGSSIRIK